MNSQIKHTQLEFDHVIDLFVNHPLFINYAYLQFMCGTFGQPDDFVKRIKQKELLKTRQQLIARDGTTWKPVIKPNQLANILTKQGIVEAKFGFVLGEFKDGRQKFWFNARVEYFENKENSTNYEGPFEIFKNKEIAPLLKSQRAVIPMSHFFESPEGNNKQKFIVKPSDNGLLFVGGVWIQNLDADSGELQDPHFCILTTAGNKATKSVNHPRSPLILEEADVDDFLDAQLNEKELSKYFKPNNSRKFEVFEIDRSQMDENNLFSPETLDDFQVVGEKRVV